MFITLSFKKSLIVEQFQGNYLKITMNKYSVYGKEEIFTCIECKTKKTSEPLMHFEFCQ